MSDRVTLGEVMARAHITGRNDIEFGEGIALAYSPARGWFLEPDWDLDGYTGLDEVEELKMQLVAAEVELKQVRDNVEAIIPDLWSYAETATGAEALAARLRGAIA